MHGTMSLKFKKGRCGETVAWAFASYENHSVQRSLIRPGTYCQRFSSSGNIISESSVPNSMTYRSLFIYSIVIVLVDVTFDLHFCVKTSSEDK